MSILIQPKEDYRCVIYSRQPLDKNKVYSAAVATNQPDYAEKGLVFCGDYLLDKNEYTVVSPNAEHWARLRRDYPAIEPTN
jgi:hypothetical protein